VRRTAAVVNQTFVDIGTVKSVAGIPFTAFAGEPTDEVLAIGLHVTRVIQITFIHVRAIIAVPGEKRLSTFTIVPAG